MIFFERQAAAQAARNTRRIAGSGIIQILSLFACLATASFSLPQGAAAADSHTVRPGETLYSIASRYHISPHALMAANGIRAPRLLREGHRLTIPGPQKSIVAARPAAGAATPRQAAAVPVPPPPRPAQRLSLNFANVDVRQALNTIADNAHVDILLTPGVTGTVTINLSNRTAEEAVRMIAAAAGLSVANLGAAYVVGPVAEVKKAAAECGTSETVTLAHLEPAAAKELLGRLAPRVSAELAPSALIVTGAAEDIDAARLALRELDVQPAPGPAPKHYVIRNTDPATAEKTLAEAFPKLKILRKEHSLSLTGTPLDVQGAEQLLRELDAIPTDTGSERESLVYPLKYVNAKTAEEALKKALPALTVVAAPEPTAPPAASFQPLSVNMMGGLSFGSSGSGRGSGSGGTSGKNEQPLSRSTRLILLGDKEELAMAQKLLDETDVAPPVAEIEAAIVEVSKTDNQEMGISWDFADTTVGFDLPGGQGLRFGSLSHSGIGFTASLKALLTKGNARLLANPRIAVVDNEDASIFIGDLVRFRGVSVVTQNSGTVQGTETIPVGIVLLVRPRIHPGGDVTLKVHPVVSTISSVVDGLPQTASREADTTVRLRREEDLVIGGLDRNELVETVHRVPILGKLPVLGSLFSNRENRTTKTELIVLLNVRSVPTEDESVRKEP